MDALTPNEWLIFGVVAVLALLVAWWLLRRRPERIRAETPDVLTPGAAPAARNALLVDAPPTAVPPVTSDQVAVPRPVPEAGAGDDLTRMKGVGPKVSAMLADLGITRFDQIAAWTADDIAAIDAKLGAFQGRIVRDGWTEQARFLATDDIAGFEAKFGKV